MRPGAAQTVLLLALLGLVGCGEESSRIERTDLDEDSATAIAHLYLDHAVAAQDGDDLLTVYFRALDPFRENIDVIDFKGLVVEDSGEAIADRPLVAELATSPREGVSVVVVFDRSKVTAVDGVLDQTRTAILELIDHMEASGWSRHAFAAVAFAKGRELIVPFGSSIDAARSTIASIEADPTAFDAALLDGIDLAIETIRSAPDIPRRTILLVVSEGEHNLSQPTKEDEERVLGPRIASIVESSRPGSGNPAILVHTLGHPNPYYHQEHIDLFDQISTRTGGEHLRSRDGSQLGSLMIGVFDEAFRSLKALVRVDMDGKPHRLGLRVGRRASEAIVIQYPRHFEIGPAEVGFAAGGIVLVALVGLVAWVRRPARLVFTGGVGPTEPVRLRQGHNRIGLSATNEVRIADPSVADHHATILMRGSAVVIEDAGSESGTFVNGEAMQRRSLESGDRIRIGDVEARYER